MSRAEYVLALIGLGVATLVFAMLLAAVLG